MIFLKISTCGENIFYFLRNYMHRFCSTKLSNSLILFSQHSHLLGEKGVEMWEKTILREPWNWISSSLFTAAKGRLEIWQTLFTTRMKTLYRGLTWYNSSLIKTSTCYLVKKAKTQLQFNKLSKEGGCYILKPWEMATFPSY